MSMSDYIKINGFRLFGFKDKSELIQFVTQNPGILVALNAEKIYRRERELQQMTWRGIGYADGTGAVWALKKQGLGKAKRLPGSELWLDLVDKLHRDEKIYLVGSTTPVIDAVVKRLHSDFPEIQIAGYRNGFLDESDILQLEEDVLKTKPGLIFVAQGSPRQEKLMLRLQSRHQAIYMGLGGSFDVFTGKVSRAPAFYRNNGLEWLYRLVSQPSRIKRQIVYIPFALRLLMNRFD